MSHTVVVPLLDFPSITIGSATHGVEIGAAAVTVAVIDGERRCQRTAIGIDGNDGVGCTRGGSIVGVAVPSGGATANVFCDIIGSTVVYGEVERYDAVAAMNGGEGLGGSVVACGVGGTVNPGVTVAGRMLIGGLDAVVDGEVESVGGGTTIAVDVIIGIGVGSKVFCAMPDECVAIGLSRCIVGRVLDGEFERYNAVAVVGGSVGVCRCRGRSGVSSAMPCELVAL